MEPTEQKQRIQCFSFECLQNIFKPLAVSLEQSKNGS